MLVLPAQQRTPAPYNSSIKINSIRTWTSAAPVTDPAVLITKNLQDVNQVTQYFDGLGRPFQTVAKKGSMASDGASVDLVSPVVYDNYGRELLKYLPFAANNFGGNPSVSNGSFKMNPFQQDSVFNKGQFPGETCYYSKTIYEASPLNRALETYAPGNSWAGSETKTDPNLRRNIVSQQKINTTADSVRIWLVNGTAFTTTAIFGNNQLYKTVTTDEHKKQTIEYKNKEGQVLLKKVQLLNSPSSGHYGWLCTYYVYDHLNRLRLVIQPRGIELLMANAWNINALGGDILNEQCFRYEYDGKGRMIIQKVPGAAEVWKVYDARDRIVLQQDGNLRTANKWLFTKYDAQNRPVMTGMYRNTAQLTQAAMQSFLNSQNLGFAENYPTTSFPYYSLNQTFPVIGDTALLTVAWFDNYSWAAGFSGFGSKDNSFDAQFPAASNTDWPYPQPLAANITNTTGLATGSWDKTGNGLVNAIFYDDYGRVIQTRTKNITGEIDLLTTQYSFSGQVLQTLLRHKKSGANAQTHTVINKFQYDDLWRLLTVKQSVSSTIGATAVTSAEQIIVSNSYDALGQLLKKKLGNKPGVSGAPLSNLEYEYNIRGWLTAINKGYLTAANNDQYFAMQLGYDKNGTLGIFSPLFNGNIGGTIWKNESDQRVRKYDFAYDASNRITAANFNQYVSGSGTSAVFDKSAGLDFSLTSMSYDANGNILSMNQKGWKISGSSYIDSLKYNYYNNGNLLMNVIDAVNDTATRLGDFRSSKAYMNLLSTKNATTTDYTYDVNGNMNKDLNKDIDDPSLAGIEYNHLNLPVKIRVKGKGSIEYLYDNGGNKLSKTVVDTVTDITTITLYIAGFEYRNDTLQQLMHSEGRVRLEQPTINTCQVLPLRFVYDYFLKDHLGNVRAVLTEEQPSDCYLAATVEDARVATEEKVYHIVPARIISKATTGATQTSFENKLYRTHGGLTNEKTGLAVVLKVMAGDKVAIRGESFYSLPGGNAGAPLTMGLVELLTSFVGSNIASMKGVSATTDVSGISGNPAALTSFVNSNALGTNTAKAAVNWILFDEQFKYVAADFDGVVAGGGYKNHVKFVNSPVGVSKSGYLYIYISNESNLPVYFDNLQVTHTRGPILEVNDYYPFGLTMAGISSKALKLGYAENKKKFVGQDFESDLGWDMYQFRFRTHDPQIGRFNQIDPLADKYVYNSTYAYAENRVINGIDLEGLEWLGLPLLGSNPTVLRGPIIEQVIKPTLEVGGKAAEVGAKTSEVGNKVPKMEEHHIIPRELKGERLVQAARKEGFKFEGKENKIPLEKFDKSTGEGQHGPHPNYTNEISKRFVEFQDKNPNWTPQQAIDFIRGTVKDLKESINSNPQTKLNDLFKSVLPPQVKDGILIGIPAPGSIGPKPKPQPVPVTIPYI
ncbi:DUF6443 domain-containing protein [Pseudobacter ginsenosidimutans]|uniref:DUF6443 domain-containing protein n=1 Tax=Pseudobacter ginsenosidimutans TaxID=661488 RepID=UPI001CEF9103|nr:DUF6443 domain-containing protein [Pseudobacter ginsenosidimutans]